MSAHVLAIATAAAAFILILAGGLVHATGSGLACPDWPLCRGEVFPSMTGGVAYEHGHRLIAAAVIAMCLALAVLLRRSTNRRLRIAASSAVALILVQAVLGGLTVLWQLPPAISAAHQAVSLLVFVITIYLAVRTRVAPGTGTTPAVAPGLAAVAVLALYVQMVLGAVMRHTASGLACTDFPRCLGSWWPAEGHAQLAMAHRLAGFAAATLVLATTMSALVHRPQRRAVLALAVSSPLLAIFQLWLGWHSVRTLLDVPTVETHMAVATLLLAMQLALALLARAPAGVKAEDTATVPASPPPSS